MTGFGIRARFAQCAFLVAQVEICQSPDFVIYMSNNPSSNCFRLLRRLVVLYEGEISLHFDPPSQHSHRKWSLLLMEYHLFQYFHNIFPRHLCALIISNALYFIIYARKLASTRHNFSLYARISPPQRFFCSYL